MASVAVVGAGAIGLTFAFAIEEAGAHELVVCGRTPLDRVEIEREGSRAELRARVSTDLQELADPVDWLLLAVKAHQTAGAAGWLERLCGAFTRVLVLQNGVEQRELVEPLARGAEVLPAIVWVPAEVVSPGHVVVRGEVRLSVPDHEGGRAVAELFDGSSARIDLIDDFVTEAWRKLCVNAVVGLSVLPMRRMEVFAREEMASLAHRYAEECAAVARAEGAKLDDDFADRLVADFQGFPPDLGTSMLFDREAGRPLEWDARNAVIQRRAATHGIPTPVSDVVVPLLAAASA